ncbi:MAG: ACT domain-containing protein, partial [Acutalibacteraceae bacterium]
MKNASYLLVDASSLPDVYGKVLQVKQLLANREASSTSEAVRMVGISRSVFYKYKDAVFPYNKKQSSQILTIQAVLLDRPGVLMALMAVFYDVGANILTINQNIPVDGRALISVSARTESMELPVENLLEKLR